MRRLGNGLFKSIISKENLALAHENSKKGKGHYREVLEFETQRGYLLRCLRRKLLNNEFNTSKYRVKQKLEGRKLRTIYSLPYYPDRIVQHAILQVVESYISKSFIRDTFQSIKGRGTSDARKRVLHFIKNNHPTHYLQLDIEKYYPSVKNEIMKMVVGKYIKCKDTICILNNIINSCEGLPIGNYTSQILGNMYLSDLDWFIKQKLGVSGYFRYCDDLVLFGVSAGELHRVKRTIEHKLLEIGLRVKPSWKVATLNSGLDFVGYQFYTDGIKLRKSIYKSAKNAIIKGKEVSIPAYHGWVKPLKDSKIKREYYNAIRKQKK